MLKSVVVALALLPALTIASYCGKAGVPYSFEVLPSGAPVLGCAQPSCVVSPDDFVEDSEFLTDGTGQIDGFFREGDRALKRYRHESAPKLVANCSDGFSQLSCPRKNQWVGGIEYIDHPRQPLILQCCQFDGLRFSQEVGMTIVGPGEAITGGEVVRNGRQISFDVVANVRKIVQSGHGHKPSYEVTVRRMNCLPDPPEAAVDFDKEVPAEILRVLSSAKPKGFGTQQKFEKNAGGGKKTDVKYKKGEQNNLGVETEPASVAVNSQAGGAEVVQPAPPAQSVAPEIVQPRPVPGFGAPVTPAPLPTLPPFGVTLGPEYYRTSTSTWDMAVSNQPPPPTYANGDTVFPTIGTGYMTTPSYPTFAPFPGPGVTPPPPPPAGFGLPPQPAPGFGAFPGFAPLPQPPQQPFPGFGQVQVPATSGGGSFGAIPAQASVDAPAQQQLPALVQPPPFSTVESQGAAAARGAAEAAAGAGAGAGQAQGAPQAPVPAQAQAAPVYQPPAFTGFPTLPPPPPFTFATLPPFTFATLPPPPAPAQGGAAAQGTPLLFPGFAPLQFPALAPLNAPSGAPTKR